MAADEISSEQMAFFIKHTSGLICCPMPESRVHELNLGMMVIDNSDLHQTAFTVSVDYKTNSTGISAVDRSSTARALANVESKPSDFRRPGHMFPLKSRDLKSRQGHTEAAVCLCLLAGKSGVGVISEIVSVKNPCLMATRQELLEMSKEWEMVMISVDQLVAYMEN